MFAPLENSVGHTLKLLDIVQKIWAPLGELFAPPGVPSWLRACPAFYGQQTASKYNIIQNARNG